MATIRDSMRMQAWARDATADLRHHEDNDSLMSFASFCSALVRWVCCSVQQGGKVVSLAGSFMGTYIRRASVSTNPSVTQHRRDLIERR